MKLNKDQKKHIHRFNQYDTVQAFKVMGNLYRINILLLLDKKPGLTLDQINGVVGGEFKNISAHSSKLSNAGLIQKKYKGAAVLHTLSEYGRIAVSAYKSFQKDPY